MRKIIAYQVINESDFPASREDGEMAIFETEEYADKWIDYLVDECGAEGEYKVRPVLILI